MPVEGRNEQRTDQRGLTETATIQKFVIPGWLLVSIAGLLLVYAIVAELAGFHLFLLRPWGGTVLVHRPMEFALLWTLCCTGVGWAIHLRRKRPRHQGRYWPITSLPTVTAIWASAIGLAQEYTQNYILSSLQL